MGMPEQTPFLLDRMVFVVKVCPPDLRILDCLCNEFMFSKCSNLKCQKKKEKKHQFTVH